MRKANLLAEECSCSKEMEKLGKILESYKNQEGSLIPVLQKAQDEYGYLSENTMKCISRKLGVPMTQIYGVSTFYAQFKLHPPAKNNIKVCHGTACHVNGAERISIALTDELGIKEGETSRDGLVSMESVGCIGACSLSPVVVANGETYGRLTPHSVKKITRKINVKRKV